MRQSPPEQTAAYAGTDLEQGGTQPMVEFRALGPIEARVAGRPVDLGAPKQRALLALLVSRVGQPVAVDVMLEALWAGHPPPSAMTSLQAYVANLRRVLEPDRAPRAPATVLRTSPQGYLLDSSVVAVDVQWFGDHATAGWQAWDRGDAHQALSEFEAGLALWRGPAYVEVASATCVMPEVARLDELRVSVVEVRCAALLAVGAHEVAVAELEAFVQAHPLREYGCELLSLALYRAGRQADALEALRTIQQRLSEELGIDPRPALKRLEHEILNHDPALDWQQIHPANPSERSFRALGGPPISTLPASTDKTGGPQAGRTSHPQTGRTGGPQAGRTGGPQRIEAGGPQGVQAGRPQAASTGHPQATPTGRPQASQTGHPQATPTSRPQASQTGHPQATPTSHPQATQTSHPQAGHTGGPQAGRTGGPQRIEAGGSQGVQAGRPQATSTGHPQASQTSHPRGGQAGLPQVIPTVPSPREPTRAPETRAPAPVTPVPDGEVFVGREVELRQLGEALAAAKGGRGRVVTVSGEPGIGKTSLLRRFAEQAGVPVLWGTCPEHVDAPPLWLWEQVLRAAGTRFPDRPVPEPVTELLDGDTEELLNGADMPSARLRRFEAIVHYLTDASHTEPLVVLLDHLHRADLCSLRLLAHLAETVPSSRLLLAVSYRSGEAAGLAEALAALARAGMTRIELTGLSTRDTHTLTTAFLHQEVSQRTAEALWTRTEGHPFFLRELIKLLASEHEQPHTAPVPVPVREVVLRRIARLPQDAAEVLSVAAIAGRHFDIEVVAEAASVELEPALEALDTAIAAGLVVEDHRRLGWFRFTHTLAAEALYETTGRLRRARLHRRVGAAAARAWTGNSEMAAEVARHWLLAAELDPTAAAHASAHAATAARAANTPEDAVTLWRHALTAAGLAEQEHLDRHPLLVGLGTSLYLAGHPHDGLGVFIQAMDEALADPDTSRPVTAAVTAVGELNSYPAHYGEVNTRLVDVLERMLSQVTEPVQRALVLSCLAVARYHDGDPAHRAALSDEALSLARTTTDTVALANVLRLRAAALNGPDHVEQCLDTVTELLSLPRLPPLVAARARQLHAHVLVAVGRVAEAADELDHAAQLEAERCLPLRTQLTWSRAGLLLLDGRWREAEELSRTAYDRHARMTWGDARLNRMLQRWEAAYLTGGGGSLVDELRVVAESSGLPALHGLLAMALVEAGQSPEARTALRRFPRESKKDYLWLHTRCWALLAAARLGDRDRVARWRAELLPYRELTCAVLDVAVSGSVAYFTAEAALALDDPGAALADLAIATETTRRMCAQPWLDQVCEATERARRHRTASARSG